MAIQENLFKSVKQEQIERIYEPSLPLDLILEPTDALEPSRDMVDSVNEQGIIEPLIVRQVEPNLFELITGRRRYRAAKRCHLKTVPALITRVSISLRDVLTIKLNRLRTENLLSDIGANERLTATGFDDSQIGDLTGLTKGEIERRMQLAMADPRLREIMREGSCPPSVAEAAAKLPLARQKILMDRFANEGLKRLTMRDVVEVKEARSKAAVDALPSSLFTDSPDLPANDHHPGNDPHQWLYRFAGQLWETLLKLEETGALELKSNKSSRAACADARSLMADIKPEEVEKLAA
jgi:ParB/RepB/Spo0J family partition protein